MKNDYNSEIRSTVLRYSIELEELASDYISRLLYITKWEETKSFGYSRSSLSFYQKIQLINDISALRVNAAKINCFQIVRNKFIHTTQFNSLLEIANHYKEVRTIINKGNNFEESILQKNFENLYREIKIEIESLNDITTSDALTIMKSKLTESFYEENCKLNSKLYRIANLIENENPDLEKIKNVIKE